MKKFVCSLDCFDICSMFIEKKGEEYITHGDKDHPITKGYICNNGKRHIERAFHKKRIRRPLLKKNGKFEEISLEEASLLVADKLGYYKSEFGSNSIMFYTDCGYGGVSKEVDEMFFDHFGGVSSSKGGLCWSAGNIATKYDFGDNRCNEVDDLKNAEVIVVWGRNPAVTNIHLVEKLKHANDNGAKVFVIDPVFTKTAKLPFVEYIQINPATDGFLAYTLISMLIENKQVEESFVNSYTEGYEYVKNESKKFDINKCELETGIDKKHIMDLYNSFANFKSSVILGYGIQRYKNGGNTVRIINALSTLSGNIAKSGAHIHYNNKSISRFISGPLKESEKYGVNKRYYSKTKMADFIDKWSIKCLFITKSNPLVQMANTNKISRAFDKVEFKIGVDMFITDTMKKCDLVIPCTSILEEDEFIFSSMYNPYLNYSNKNFEKTKEVVSEYEWFSDLAKLMGISSYPQISKEEFFKETFSNILDLNNITLDELKAKPFKIDEDIPFKNMNFPTESRKVELFSKKAEAEGHSGFAIYIPPETKEGIRLLTIHHKDTINSQGFLDYNDIPIVMLNPMTLPEYKDGDEVFMVNDNGKIKCRLKFDIDIIENIAVTYQGYWWENGCVNMLTDDQESDMGGQTAYYDTFVKFERS